MQILAVEDIRALDAYTIENEPIDSIDLMERAAIAFVKWFVKHFLINKRVVIYCGLGNNGGDGLAIARLLLQRDYKVDVYVVRYSDKSSVDFRENLRRLSKSHTYMDIEKPSDIPNYEDKTDIILIDAIFGSGLTREITGLAADVIRHINSTRETIVSVDIASGLFADRLTTGDVIVRPNYTLSFQVPKLAFMIPENEDYVGDWCYVPIGLSQDFLENVGSRHHYITEDVIRTIYRRRKKFSHKGHFGKVLLFVGSLGKIGAAVLSAKACLRAGVGLIFVHIPNCGYHIMQTVVPEAMVSVDKHEEYITIVPDYKEFKPEVIGIGPGIGQNIATTKFIGKILKQTDRPMVLDADALNIIAKEKKYLDMIPPYSILTPHVREFERLVGKSESGFDRLEKLRKFTKKYKVIVILKGSHSAIANPEGDIYFNSTGNPGMATAGSGDVLTGIVSSLLAQGYEPFKAAILAVYVHGLAGDLARNDKGEEGMIAGDIVEYLGKAFLELAKIASDPAQTK